MWQLIVTSFLLGIGLAMDACAVSMANGLNEPQMKVGKVSMIAFAFGVFQAVMPLIGWACVHFIAQKFEAFSTILPWISLVLLGFIGAKMIYEGANRSPDTEEVKKLSAIVLLTQAVATSIDALSVGFTIAEYNFSEALLCVAIIAVVTFGLSFGSVYIGKKFGTKLGKKAEILGGIILIAIGVEIFVSNVFF